MTHGEFVRLLTQLSVLREVRQEYRGKTIDSIIQQMEMRKEEFIRTEAARKEGICLRG